MHAWRAYHRDSQTGTTARLCSCALHRAPCLADTAMSQPVFNVTLWARAGVCRTLGIVTNPPGLMH